MFFFGSVYAYSCMISYDEGPSKNLIKAINEGVSLQIPLVFFLDPFTDLFNKEVVDNILETGYEVGMSLTEEVNDDTILDILDKYEKEFINKSGYKSVLLRLPAVGRINKEIIMKCESKGYVVDIPNLDSEDDQKADIWPFLSPAIYQCRGGVSLVFRDRYEKSVDLLKSAVDLFWRNGYKIVSAGEFIGKQTKPVLVSSNIINISNISKEDTFITKYEILRHSTPYTIRVYTKKGDDEVKEVTVKYSTYNKLFIRDLLKVSIKSDQELEDLYKEITDVCEIADENEVKACQNNGVLICNIWYCGLVLFLM